MKFHKKHLPFWSEFRKERNRLWSVPALPKCATIVRMSLTLAASRYALSRAPTRRINKPVNGQKKLQSKRLYSQQPKDDFSGMHDDQLFKSGAATASDQLDPRTLTGTPRKGGRKKLCAKLRCLLQAPSKETHILTLKCRYSVQKTSHRHRSPSRFCFSSGIRGLHIERYAQRAKQILVEKKEE